MTEQQPSPIDQFTSPRLIRARRWWRLVLGWGSAINVVLLPGAMYIRWAFEPSIEVTAMLLLFANVAALALLLAGLRGWEKWKGASS